MSVVDKKSVIPDTKGQITCNVCNKSFKRFKDLKSHSVIHYDLKPYVCNLCPEAFKHKTSLKRHSLIHTGEKPFACRICAKSFRQKGSLNEHFLIHTGVRPHICEVCDIGFTTKSNYSRHLRNHLISKPFICNICHRGFNVRSYLTHHYKKHQEVDELLAKIESCSNNSLLEMDTIQQSVTSESVEDMNDKLHDYNCKTCNLKFKEFNSLQIHLLSHTNKKGYTCDICNQCFMNVGDFYKHKTSDSCQTIENSDKDYLNKNLSKLIKASESKEFTENKTPREQYICHVCNDTFSKEYHFMHHSIIHKYPGPYYCDMCGENIEFKKLDELHKHYAEHGEIPCICYICNENSDDISYSKGTVSKCDACHKCFPDKTILKEHLSVHKNRRPLLIKLNA